MEWITKASQKLHEYVRTHGATRLVIQGGLRHARSCLVVLPARLCRPACSVVAYVARQSGTVAGNDRRLWQQPEQYMRFCGALGLNAATATLEHVSLFLRHLRGDGDNMPATQPVGNATLQQRLTAVRLRYDHLVYQGVREGIRFPVDNTHSRADISPRIRGSSVVPCAGSSACRTSRRTASGLAYSLRRRARDCATALCLRSPTMERCAARSWLACA